MYLVKDLNLEERKRRLEKKKDKEKKKEEEKETENVINWFVSLYPRRLAWAFLLQYNGFGFFLFKINFKYYMYVMLNKCSECYIYLDLIH